MAEVKYGEEVGDKAEKTAWSQVVKDPKCHVIDTEISFFSDGESHHLNQSRMITFRLDFSESSMKNWSSSRWIPRGKTNRLLRQ